MIEDVHTSKEWENEEKSSIYWVDKRVCVCGVYICQQVLGLSKGVTQAEITSRYRMLVREMHPDKIHNGNREEAVAAFTKIQSAYETLSKIKEKRARRQSTRKQEAYEFDDI